MRQAVVEQRPKKMLSISGIGELTMTDRERLIELLKKAFEFYIDDPYCIPDEGEFADHLLANGVIVPPCKVGDKTFLLLEKIMGGYDIVESQCVRICDNGYGKVYSMDIDCVEIDHTLECRLDDFGVWVFLTKEDAEQALKERE